VPQVDPSGAEDRDQLRQGPQRLFRALCSLTISCKFSDTTQALAAELKIGRRQPSPGTAVS
jgi:hypothetical protein